jgi:hypothetical protein
MRRTAINVLGIGGQPNMPHHLVNSHTHSVLTKRQVAPVLCAKHTAMDDKVIHTPRLGPVQSELAQLERADSAKAVVMAVSAAAQQTHGAQARILQAGKHSLA